MPFTFSHPSAVLILRKIFPGVFFSATALVAGSMVPDFEAFIFMKTTKTFSHSWLGMFVFDLPLGLATCFLWHDLVKVPFIDHLPIFLKRKVFRFRNFDWDAFFTGHIISVIVSLLLGIASHLLWDNFTHPAQGAMPSPAITIYSHRMADFIFWQYASSVIGLIIVFVFFVKLPSSVNVPVVHGIRYWGVVSLITGVVITIKLMTMHEHFMNIEIFLYVMFIIFLSSFMIGILVTSLLSRYFYKYRIT